MAVTLKFSGSLSQSDPAANGVLIVGQTRHLAQVNYDDIKVKFGTHVDREVMNPNEMFCLFLLNWFDQKQKKISCLIAVLFICSFP